MALDSDGNLYIADFRNNRIQKKVKPKGFLFENVYRIVGANSGKDAQGKAQKDIAVYDGRATETDVNGNGKIDDNEKKDFSVTHKGYVVCIGVDSDICSLTQMVKADTDDVSAPSSAKVGKDTGLSISSGAKDGSKLTGGKKITITSEGDDSGVKFTVKGKDINGNSIEEVVSGAKGTGSGASFVHTVFTLSSTPSITSSAGNFTFSPATPSSLSDNTKLAFKTVNSVGSSTYGGESLKSIFEEQTTGS